jgi:hypothetical protein
VAALVVVGCSSPPNDDPVPGTPISFDPSLVGSAADECAAYCQKQEGLCAQSLPANDCVTSCIAAGQTVPGCEKDLASFNHCLSLAVLECSAQGRPTTTSCLFYSNAYGVCADLMAPRDGG